jgi:hypothetical protein
VNDEPSLDSADPIDQLARLLGTSWPTIARARRLAAVQQRAIADRLAQSLPLDTSLVASGSLGRGEVTSGSDIDWILLVDGQAAAGHLDAVYAIEDALVGMELKKPGRGGTFGNLTFSHELLHEIGGERDTNANLTRRVLLLLESRAIVQPEAFSRVRRQILKRYLEEDVGWHHVRGRPSVPLFFLNDISRYWRTVAVDYAQKRRVRRTEGWAIRTVKLGFSRKLTYVAGLFSCFGCARIGIDVDRASDRTKELVSYLERMLSMTPLEVFAETALRHWYVDSLRSTWGDIFARYEEFLALLDDPEARQRLEQLSQEDALADTTFARTREVRKGFSTAIERVFFDGEGTDFPRWTRRYGVF